LSQPKRLGLLVYLAAATNGQAYRRRDTLLSHFWPELDEDRARRALRQAMYVLRRHLGDGVIRARGEDELGVDGTVLWVDSVAFERALASGDHREAAELYRGDFLDGFFVSGAGAEFDEWVAGERRRLRELASRVMWVVAEEAVTQEPESAAGRIRKGLALAPDNEVAVRQALDRLIRIGDHAGALHLFHEFRERLEREMPHADSDRALTVSTASAGVPSHRRRRDDASSDECD
jgi:serine/threonine-protein kinase